MKGSKKIKRTIIFCFQLPLAALYPICIVHVQWMCAQLPSRPISRGPMLSFLPQMFFPQLGKSLVSSYYKN